MNRLRIEVDPCEVNKHHGWSATFKLERQWDTPGTVGEGAVTGTLVHCWSERRTLRPLQKTVRQFLTKLTIVLTTGSFRPLSIYPTEMKSCVCVDSTFIRNYPKQGATKMSLIGEEISKQWFTHAREDYSALKGNDLLSHKQTWLNMKCLRNEGRRAA